MSDSSALARAVESFGLHWGYHDIWGQYHPLGEASARTILGALGVDTSSDEAIEAALAARDAARWRRAFDPTVLVYEGAPVTIAVAVDEAHREEQATIELECEDGARHRFEISLGEQDTIEACDVADAGRVRRVSVRLPFTPPPGYHRLGTDVGRGLEQATLIVAPRRCLPCPRRADGGRLWGLSLQLYALRSNRNWGMGDFGDLARAATALAALGADLVGVNPLHALYPHRPEQASPYSPSSRRFANPLYIDVEAVADFGESDEVRDAVAAHEFQARLSALRATPLVDYRGVAALKWDILDRLFSHFRAHHLDTDSDRGAAFRAFREAGGAALRAHAVFEAIGFVHGDGERPAALRGPDEAATAEFAKEHARLVERQIYWQWLATLQLDAAQRSAREAGMAIGLYLDLAVGSDATGADTWSQPHGHARGISLGAPPDDFALQGQVWGLSPWPPPHLEATGFTAWRDVLRANMKSAGAIRIDHVIGLLRQFWVPDGATAADGAYVQCPFETLLAILALESVRTDCTVVGEDLGTVPPEARAGLERAGSLAYRVLWFEKRWHGDHEFLSPREIPAQALVTVTTHDLPTLAGWWRGRDLDIRESLGLFADQETIDRLRAARIEDRDRLLRALTREGLHPDGPTVTEDDSPTPALAEAIHRYAARSRAALMMVQLEDVLGALEQTNVPGTVDEQPNWQRKLDLPIEDWPTHRGLHTLANALNAERPTD